MCECFLVDRVRKSVGHALVDGAVEFGLVQTSKARIASHVGRLYVRRAFGGGRLRPVGAVLASGVWAPLNG